LEVKPKSQEPVGTLVERRLGGDLCGKDSD
jgi:hypothetical protein